ncbi:MAG: TraM recognition domain-containing protein, partial [Bacteroidota bacterium]
KNSATHTNDLEKVLDKKLYDVPGTGQSVTWADAVEGTLILGATGSGKTSGPGKHAALAMLEAGWGFCIMCAKTDEKDRWLKYAESTGRIDDVVILNKESGYKFNFLTYELTRDGEGSGEVINAINTIMNLNEQNKVYQSGAGGQGKEEPFWDQSLRRLISRAITLLMITNEEVSISNMREVVASCLKDDEPSIYFDLKETATTEKEIDPEKREDARSKLSLWIKTSYFLQLIEKLDKQAFNSDEDRREALFVKNYWLRELPKVGERVLGIIIESFMGIIEPFISRGILKTQFSGGLDEELLPETIINERKIVIVDYPIKEHGLAGIFASIIYKSTFMAAMERRYIKEEANPLPVCLWVDEYQNFCNPAADTLFQTTARSSWVATVYITQNVNNMYFVMGHNNPIARAKSLLGNLNLKYFASNADWDTNQWASQMIGQTLTDFRTVNYKENSADKRMDISTSKNQQMQYRITPDHFTTLKTGRAANDNIVEAVVFKAGKLWGKEQSNFAIVEFKQ